MHVAPAGGTTVQDHLALAEIELCGELIIAASAAREERLSLVRIDEVLKVAEEREAAAGRGAPSPARPPPTATANRHERSSRPIAFVASSTLASISSPPLSAASATQWRRCSSRSWSAKDCRALVEAET